jgi:Flp pilus assembly protein TadD
MDIESGAKKSRGPNPDPTIAAYQMALHEARLAQDSKAEAAALTNLGEAHVNRGELQQAIAEFNRLWRFSGGGILSAKWPTS